MDPKTENEQFAIEEGVSYCTECDAVVQIDAPKGKHCITCPCRAADGSCDPSRLG